MASILVLGAGRSATALISYLSHYVHTVNGSVTVGDISFPERNGSEIHFDIRDKEQSRQAIRAADVVVSMIPAHLHAQVAALCLEERKHLLTASYVTDEMKAMDREATEKNLLFLNECGLDPGIDHMSAMQVLDRLRREGGYLTSFESFTGGLIAPETDPANPWRYKFTWNPRNVVMAGQGTSRFLQQGQFRYIPYQQLFRQVTRVSIPGQGEYEGYANRDSLKYRETYGLRDIQTMVRGTLRYRGFCSAWDVLVQLGCTDDSYSMENVQAMTHRSFIESFLPWEGGLSVEEKLVKSFRLTPAGPELARLGWSGLFDPEPVGLGAGTPAQVLEHILTKKWKLNPGDRDLVVMWHRFGYRMNGKDKELQASLVAVGQDSLHTAMAKTVGLPLGIAARLLIEGKISKRGVAIPVFPELYEPVLAELNALGISLAETAIV